MAGKCFLAVSKCLIYWRGLLTEAQATSARFVGFWAKLVQFAVALAPLGIIIPIGVRNGFTLRDWLWFPGQGFLLWIMFLMLIAAYKKHAKAEEQARIKLSINNVTSNKSVTARFRCQATIHNLSMAEPAKNVIVWANWEVAQDRSLEGYGYSTSRKEYLAPSAGSNEINPDLPLDFEFGELFNEMVKMFDYQMRSRGKGEKPRQRFKITASSSTSPPKHEEYEIVEDSQTGGIAFQKL